LFLIIIIMAPKRSLEGLSVIESPVFFC